MAYNNKKHKPSDIDIESLFENDGFGADAPDEMEPVFDIDIEGIEHESDDLATSILQNVAKVYSSETFLKDNPDFKKRLDSEIRSLKLHLKMLAIDDRVQDELVKAIGRKADNASLYAALPKHQASMINIQNKIDSTLDRIQNMLKGYQTEMSFDEDEDEEEGGEGKEGSKPLGRSFRGSRDFIMQFKDKSSADIFEEDSTDDAADAV